MNSTTKKRTKDNIKQGFRMLLLEEKDIKKINVKKLSEKVGINRSTFYLYFHDIYEIGEEISEEIMEVLFKKYEVITNISDIYNLLNYAINYLEDNNNEFFTYLYFDDIEIVISKFQKKAFDIIYNSKIITKYNNDDFFYYLQFYLDGLLQNLVSSIKQKDFTNVKKHSINIFNKMFL